MIACKEQRPILIVEDQPAQYEALRRALRQVGCRNPLLHCADGDAALELLFESCERNSGLEQPNPTPTFSTPRLVILDLNLPGTDGQTVLRTIREHGGLRVVPVVVFSSLVQEGTIRACYAAGANGYISKPTSYDDLLRTTALLVDYWFHVVRLPG